MKKLLALTLLSISVFTAGWLLIATNTAVTHKLMLSVSGLSVEKDLIFQNLLKGKYVAFPANDNISQFDLLKRANFWSELNEVDTYTLVGQSGAAIVYSRFKKYYQIETYKNEAVELGKKVNLYGIEANFVSFPEEKIFLVFVPYNEPDYVLTVPSGEMVLDSLSQPNKQK